MFRSSEGVPVAGAGCHAARDWPQGLFCFGMWRYLEADRSFARAFSVACRRASASIND